MKEFFIIEKNINTDFNNLLSNSSKTADVSEREMLTV